MAFGWFPKRPPEAAAPAVAALALTREWGLGYGDLLKYATPGFFALRTARRTLATASWGRLIVGIGNLLPRKLKGTDAAVESFQFIDLR